MAPYAQHVIDTARAHGVDPAFVFSQIAAESSGVPTIEGDKNTKDGLGSAVGLYQVREGLAKNYGMTAAMRSDPIKATTAIMPTFKRMLDNAKGDWAMARLGHMRPAMYSRVLAGEDVNNVLRGSPIARGQYDKFKGLQQTFSTPLGTTPATTPAPTPESQAQFMTAQAPGAAVGVQQQQQDPQLYAAQYQQYADDGYEEPPLPSMYDFLPAEQQQQNDQVLYAQAEQYVPPTEYEQMLAHFRATRQG
jgi:hypothetical protein